jgi:hypothetical protein
VYHVKREKYTIGMDISEIITGINASLVKGIKIWKTKL